MDCDSFEDQFRHRYECTGRLKKWQTLFNFINRFPQVDYLYLHNVPVLYRLVVLLSNFLAKPYSRRIYKKFVRLVKNHLIEGQLISPEINRFKFKQYLRYLKQDIRKLETIIYALVHKRKLNEIDSDKSIRCHAISKEAELFQCYDKKSIYNLAHDTETFKPQFTNILSLPDHILVRILTCLDNESIINSMISCKQLFKIVTSFCKPSVLSKTDLTLHPSKGICINYKFAFDHDRTKQDLTMGAYLKHKLTYPIDRDLCVCPLCHATCSCDFSKHQQAGSLKKLLFKKCKLGTVMIRTSADFQYMMTNLSNVPSVLKIDIPIGKYALSSLFNKFKFYKCLDYVLDVRMFTNIEFYWPFIAPAVDRLHIKFLPSSPSYSSDLPVVKRILRSHLKAIKKQTPKMTQINVTNCLFLEEIFYFRSCNTLCNWQNTIKEIHINNSTVKCDLFKQLPKMTGLSLLTVNRSNISSKCQPSHFNYYFRTDFLNFENVPNTKHFIYKRSSFLNIVCDIKNAHCMCQDMSEKPPLKNLLYGRFVLEKCRNCNHPPVTCPA